MVGAALLVGLVRSLVRLASLLGQPSTIAAVVQQCPRRLGACVSVGLRLSSAERWGSSTSRGFPRSLPGRALGVASGCKVLAIGQTTSLSYNSASARALVLGALHLLAVGRLYLCAWLRFPPSRAHRAHSIHLEEPSSHLRIGTRGRRAQRRLDVAVWSAKLHATTKTRHPRRRRCRDDAATRKKAAHAHAPAAESPCLSGERRRICAGRREYHGANE